MKIVFSHHANQRIEESRQNGIAREDVYKAARRFKPKVKNPGFRITCKTSKGKPFQIVIVDKESNKRVVETIIGHLGSKK